MGGALTAVWLLLFGVVLFWIIAGALVVFVGLALLPIGAAIWILSEIRRAARTKSYTRLSVVSASILLGSAALVAIFQHNPQIQHDVRNIFDGRPCAGWEIKTFFPRERVVYTSQEGPTGACNVLVRLDERGLPEWERTLNGEFATYHAMTDNETVMFTYVDSTAHFMQYDKNGVETFRVDCRTGGSIRLEDMNDGGTMFTCGNSPERYVAYPGDVAARPLPDSG